MFRPMRVGGQFYPNTADEARAVLDDYSHTSEITPEYSRAAIVPHAGWVFSGPTAYTTLASLGLLSSARTAVLFGAVHTRGIAKPTLYPDGEWETPFGNVLIDTEYVKKFRLPSLCATDHLVHIHEHSLEVIVPMLLHINPDLRIIPVSVPMNDEWNITDYADLFRAMRENGDCVFIASSDLTHYGYNYGNLSHGVGDEALQWVKEEKDPAFLELVYQKKSKELLEYALSHDSACGAGGIALLTALFHDTEPVVIDYTTSYDMYPRGGAQSFVSYAGIVFKETK